MKKTVVRRYLIFLVFFFFLRLEGSGKNGRFRSASDSQCRYASLVAHNQRKALLQHRKFCLERNGMKKAIEQGGVLGLGKYCSFRQKTGRVSKKKKKEFNFFGCCGSGAVDILE